MVVDKIVRKTIEEDEKFVWHFYARHSIKHHTTQKNI